MSLKSSLVGSQGSLNSYVQQRAADSSNELLLKPLTVDIVDSLIVNPTGPKFKYVAYTVHLHIQGTSTEGSYDESNCFQRRYSDFRTLHQKLCKEFPQTMVGLVFPSKLYSGNFTQVNIGHRSHALEQYLGNLLEIPQIRANKMFAHFFFMKEMKDGLRHLKDSQYQLSVSVLLKAIRNLELISPECNHLIVLIFASLTHCYAALEMHEECHSSALKALERIEGNASQFLYPLLMKCIHTAVVIGKNKDDLELRLGQLQSKSDFSMDNFLTLQEVLFYELNLFSKSR